MTTTVLLFLVSGLLTTAIIPLSLPWLRRLKFGQFVRDDGPQSHLAKSGTPTMGGILFLAVIALVSLITIREAEVWAVLLVSLGFGVVGFIDDYIKVVKKRSMGFRAWQKMAAQLVITIAYIVFVWLNTANPTMIIVPFTGGMMLKLGWLFYPLCFSLSSVR